METKETLELIKIAKSGNEEAIEKIIEQNILLVKKINNKWGRTEDGIQEGIIGILKALETFDLNRNTKFSTYAYIWIKKMIIEHREKEYYKTTRQQIEKMRRNETQRIFEMEIKYNFLETAAEEEDLEKKVFLEELIKKVCNSREKTIIKKIYFEGYKLKEVAKEMEVSNQRVSKLLQRILQKLRKAIYENNYYDRRKR